MENAQPLTPAYEVGLVENLPFATVTNVHGQSETLHLDIYQPQIAPAGPLPVIFWFHGGAFRPGNDKRQIYVPMFARAFAERGIVGVAPDYRVRPEPPQDYPGTIQDAVSDGRQAVAWVTEHAAQYNIDPTRILLAGGSAGGMLVLNLVHTIADAIPGLVGVIDLWGTPGVTTRMFEHVNGNSPATFVVHGTADALVPYQNSQGFVAELAQAGIQNTFLTISDAPHTPLKHFDQMVEAIAKFLEEII
jgi:acetyl esterase/lipase